METENTYHFNSILEESNNKLWGCHFAVPDAIAQVFVSGNDRRVVCKLNEKAEYHALCCRVAMAPF
jgi:hypothetical protein